MPTNHRLRLLPAFAAAAAAAVLLSACQQDLTATPTAADHKATATELPDAAKPTATAPARSKAATAAPATKSGAPAPKAATKPSTPAAKATPAKAAAPGTAAAALATLTVKGRAPMTGYSRDQFGPAWADVDRNGCDTRNDILRRDLTAITAKPGTRGCVVASGRLADPYSGRTINFTRGQQTSMAVQIDHVVALADAWVKGAQRWPAPQRLAYANDPLNLLAADGPLNGAKGAGDAATWLPPNKAYRCAYVARQVAVKAKYKLAVTAAEKNAIAGVLTTCPGQKLPAGSAVPAPTAATPVQSAAPAPAAPAPAPAGGAGVVYANCAAVRAAGAAPIHAGEPGYSRKLDRDGDGVGCE